MSSQIVDLPSWLLILVACLRGLAALIRLTPLAHRALRRWRANRRR